MTAKEISDRKKYRNAFLVHALLGVAGVCIGIYVFKYTTLLTGKAEGYVFICNMDAVELFSRFFDEAKYLVLLYALGFTIFAVPGAIVFAVFRGFMCSVGVLRLAGECEAGGLSTAQFVFTVCALAAVFLIELIMTAKCVRQSSRLQYIAPHPGELIRDPEVRRYSASFAMLCGFMFAAVAVVYFAPLMPI